MMDYKFTICHLICHSDILSFNLSLWHFVIYARVKGHLEPTHLKSSPLFTFLKKLLGQDSPSVHLFFYNIHHREK